MKTRYVEEIERLWSHEMEQCLTLTGLVGVKQAARVDGGRIVLHSGAMGC